MTKASKLKTAVRQRAVKTGESYSAARRQVLAAKPRARAAEATLQGEPRALATVATAPPVNRDRRVPRGELSDRTTRKSTGYGLDHWFGVLDEFGKTHGHAKAADFLYSEHRVQAWHAQMITGTWERSRGLRQENQSCTGSFQVSVSRVIAAPVQWVVDAVNDAHTRKTWLKDAAPALGRAIESAFASGKSMEVKRRGYARMRYKWLSSVVELRVDEKAGGKSSIVADSSQLPDAASVGPRRAAFTHALDRLRDLAVSAP